MVIDIGIKNIIRKQSKNINDKNPVIFVIKKWNNFSKGF